MHLPGLPISLNGRWHRLLLLLLCAIAYALMGGGVSQSLAQNTAVERLSLTSSGDGDAYVLRVHLSEPLLAYRAPEKTSEGAIRWTLFNAELSSSFQQPEASGPVSYFQLEQADNHLHVDLHLDELEAYSVEAYRDRGSPHVLLRLSPAVDVDPPGIATTSSPSSSDEALSVPTAPVALTTRPASADASDRWRLDTIVIDAGHGGRDPGAIGFNGIRESDVTLATALKLGEYIEEHLEGINVVYTRTNDTFIELADRGKMANEAGGKLFISIHANSASNRNARGAETYILGTHRSEQARRVMERENSVIRFEQDRERYEEFDRSDLIMQTLTHSAYLRYSEQLASMIQDQFSERVHRQSRGVKQAGFYVLWGASMPAVLVELGFISNPDEARFLNSERGQAYMASAIFRAVREYKDQYEKGLVVQN